MNLSDLISDPLRYDGLENLAQIHAFLGAE